MVRGRSGKKQIRPRFSEWIGYRNSDSCGRGALRSKLQDSQSAGAAIQLQIVLCLALTSNPIGPRTVNTESPRLRPGRVHGTPKLAHSHPVSCTDRREDLV